MRLGSWLAAVVAGVPAMSAVAWAGGVARPNAISARGVGMGGAFTAIADDPTALHFNPAGAAWADEALMLGAELVYAPRSYIPLNRDGTRGASQDTAPLEPVPSLGVLLRFADHDGVPSRITLGAGLWSTYGGALEYDPLPAGQAAVNATEELLVELAVGGAYEVSDRLALGAVVRAGLGLFALDATMMPLDADISAAGLGIGIGLGALYRPVPSVAIGASWRSPMDVGTSGDGTVGTDPNAQPVEHEQPWPQSASVGIAARVAAPLRVSAQLDWTDWSSFDRVIIQFPEQPGLNQDLPLDWRDTIAVRLGAEYAVSDGVALRAGAYHDTNAVPDRTIERIYLDTPKYGVSAGGSVRLGARWRLDVAADAQLPASRSVPDNRNEIPTSWDRANPAPGEYEGAMYTAEVAVAWLL